METLNVETLNTLRRFFGIIPLYELRIEMSKIFDNIETKFEEWLHTILTNVGVVADDLNVAITAAFAAQVQNYEENKGKPRIVAGLLK